MLSLSPTAKTLFPSCVCLSVCSIIAKLSNSSNILPTTNWTTHLVLLSLRRPWYAVLVRVESQLLITFTWFFLHINNHLWIFRMVCGRGIQTDTYRLDRFTWSNIGEGSVKINFHISPSFSNGNQWPLIIFWCSFTTTTSTHINSYDFILSFHFFCKKINSLTREPKYNEIAHHNLPGEWKSGKGKWRSWSVRHVRCRQNHWTFFLNKLPWEHINLD